MIVVSNTSPVLNLAVIGHLDLLARLYGTVWIPNAVREELTAHRAGWADLPDLDRLPWPRRSRSPTVRWPHPEGNAGLRMEWTIG